MRTGLDHLPSHKQRELERVVHIIFEEFDNALALARHQWKKRGRIDKIVLYGSYARGGWVDEPHTAKGYQSDFDLLIIVNDKRLTDRVDYWLALEDRLNRELAITRTLRTPVNFIVHTLQEVNDGLAHGRYFFMDVAQDGIALYEFDQSDPIKNGTRRSSYTRNLTPSRPSPLYDVRAVLFARVCGLFLRVIRWRAKNRHKVAMLVLTVLNDGNHSISQVTR